MVFLYKRNGRMLFSEYEKKYKLRCLKQKVLVSTDIDYKKVEAFFDQIKLDMYKEYHRGLKTARHDRDLMRDKNGFHKRFHI